MAKTIFDNGGYVGFKGTFGQSLGSNVVTSGLVLHLDAGKTASYPGTGTTWNDISSSAMTATLRNTSYGTGGGGHFSFNGSNSAAVIPNNTVLDTQSLSIEVWMSPASSLNQNGFWFEKGTVNSQYSFFMSSGIVYWRMAGGAYDTTATVSTYMTLNNWYHMVGTHASGTQRIYINNTVAGSGTGSPSIIANTAGVSIGNANGYASPSSYPFNGRIAVVRVYNRALTATEVQQNYDDQKARFGL